MHVGAQQLTALIQRQVFQGRQRGWLKPEREKSEETNAVIQGVLMDWYEEVVVAVEISPNKLHTFEREDGWFIYHCNHETPALSHPHILKTSPNKPTKNSNELGRKKNKTSGPPLFCGYDVSDDWPVRT